MALLALIAPVATAVAQESREQPLPTRIAIVAVDSELSPTSRALAEIASDRLEQLGSEQHVQVVRSRAVEDLLSTWPTHMGDEDYRAIGLLLRVVAMVNVAILRETPPVSARAVVHPPGRRVPPDTLPLFEGASVAAVGDAIARYLLTEIVPNAARVRAAKQGENPDTFAAVVAALSFARGELLRVGQVHGATQHIINRARTDRVSAWSDAQLRVFGAVLGAQRTTSPGVAVCDSRRRECAYTATTDIVTIGAPRRRGDSVAVEIELEFPTNGARAPVALRGHRYMVVRKNGQWVVVKADMVSAT